ncbi:hypothetical protein ABTK17_20290, partial [Acinetobacter baumannii]
MSITIVMYHYVREIARSAYPGIMGLEKAAFRRQIEYLASNHVLISGWDLMDAIGGAELPENAAMVTF